MLLPYYGIFLIYNINLYKKYSYLISIYFNRCNKLLDPS
jgi:hypothetical protein